MSGQPPQDVAAAGLAAEIVAALERVTGDRLGLTVAGSAAARRGTASDHSTAAACGADAASAGVTAEVSVVAGRFARFCEILPDLFPVYGQAALPGGAAFVCRSPRYYLPHGTGDGLPGVFLLIAQRRR